MKKILLLFVFTTIHLYTQQYRTFVDIVREAVAKNKNYPEGVLDVVEDTGFVTGKLAECYKPGALEFLILSQAIRQCFFGFKLEKCIQAQESLNTLIGTLPDDSSPLKTELEQIKVNVIERSIKEYTSDKE